MSFRRILLPMNAESDISQAADLAFRLAKIHKAQVQGIFPQDDEWKNYWLDNYGLNARDIENQQLKTKRKAAEAARVAAHAFNEHAVRNGVKDAKHLSTFDHASRSLIEHTCLADVCILATSASRSDQYWRFVSRELLSQSTRPVILAPDRPVSNELGNRVVIAWKQSAEACRAIAAAMPIIERAKSVLIVSVGQNKGEKPLLALQDYVSLHGKNVESTVVASTGEETGEQLIDLAAEEPGSILVAGAFSHRRWREEVFGGVTDFLLRNADIPVLMMH